MKVIDHLKTNIIGRKLAEREPLKFTEFSTIIDKDVTPHSPIYQTEAVLRVQQIGTGAIAEEKYIRYQAAVMIADELYGEVIDGLRDILHDIYRTGPYYNPDTKKKIETMLNELTLKEPIG